MYINYLSKYHFKAQANISKLTDEELLTACLRWSVEFNRVDAKADNWTDRNKKEILFYIANTLGRAAQTRGIITEKQGDILLNL